MQTRRFFSRPNAKKKDLQAIEGERNENGLCVRCLCIFRFEYQFHISSCSYSLHMFCTWLWVDKTHKIYWKCMCVYCRPLFLAIIFMWHYIEPFNTLFIFNAFFFVVLVVLSVIFSVWIQRVSEFKATRSNFLFFVFGVKQSQLNEMKNFEWLHCLFQLFHDRKHSNFNAIFYSNDHYKCEKKSPNYAIKIAFTYNLIRK